MSDGVATRPRLALPVVCLVTDRKLVGDAHLVDAVIEAAAGGVNLVQLREKDLPTRELLDLANRMRSALDPLGTPLVVNGRADLAFAADAAGVHLPANGLPVSGARAALGDRFLVGRSVHSADEAQRANSEAVDYLILGTIFPSTSHATGPTIDLEAMRAAAGGNVPIVAIGGITAANAPAVIEAGADGVAVISAILGRSDPRQEARALCEAVERAWRSREAPSPQPSPAAAGEGDRASPTAVGEGFKADAAHR